MIRDLAVDLMRSGYRAIPTARAENEDRRAFPVRLLGRRAVVVRGEDGARLFYDRSAVRRRGAVPAPLANLLFGKGAVHGLDHQAHLDRKAAFVEALSDESTTELASRVGADLERRVHRWSGRDIGLFDELVDSYGDNVQHWAGLERSSRRMSREMAQIVDGFGISDRAFPRAWLARWRTNRWLRAAIEDVRAGKQYTPAGSVIDRFARGPDVVLDSRTAAVEVGNVLRPTVAVAWLSTFAIHALLDRPEWTERLRSPGADAEREAFANEVRRTYPFVPALAAKALQATTIHGTELRAGQRLILDVPGTNRDAKSWPDPDDFRPERFLDETPSPYQFVAQGGGHVQTGHRCPGEVLTVKLMAETLRVFSDLRPIAATPADLDMTRIPTRPAGGLRLRVP